ncbi:hypothetical protein [Donghicola tyrosinivorans]|uniref:Putative membrane-anchored protein n=1 Tax=Donghicola tyrosinivorans TaxID=1652492 RepID=A0A2T0WDQ5_9RHOB|nr:hypothetical protein [Donghicola tyrosinivorans]PRY84839.1 putative membrane-anchored protein [Donghicola tyrosinivorans]
MNTIDARIDMNFGRQTNPLNKLPEVTAAFWLIKLMAVTMGETAADYLNVNLGLGLSAASLMMTVILIGTLALQLSHRRYVPWVYWLNVALISVVGTLLTDYLVDNLGVSLVTCTVTFSALLAATFAVWCRIEGTLSIHDVDTALREAFYWLATLLTFALGTAVGDLVAEQFALGLDGILSFWLIYILTRPLGASFGDLLSQPVVYGGMGYGTIMTSHGFLAVIAITFGAMTIMQARQK